MISLFVAVAKNGVIGSKNTMPWYLKADLRRFAQLTKGHTLIMGRRTHDSIIARLGHPLVDRKSVVLTSADNISYDDVTVVRSWEDALEHISPNEETFVIGGAEVYGLAISEADKLYLTEVHALPEGDVYFPKYDTAEWRELSSEHHQADKENEYDYTFKVLERQRD